MKSAMRFMTVSFVAIPRPALNSLDQHAGIDAANFLPRFFVAGRLGSSQAGDVGVFAA